MKNDRVAEDGEGQTPKSGSLFVERRVLTLVLAVALVLNLGVAIGLGLNRPMQSDSFYFLCIAKSLAQGHGYVLQEGFWPAAPTMSRAPGWPWVVSLGLRALPGANPDAMMRVMAGLLNTLAAGLVAGLAWVLFRRRLTAVCSGLAYALYPVALYEAYEGTSEILFIVMALAGTLLLLNRDWRRPVGVLTLGAAALVRPNFVAWIVFAGAVLAWQAVCYGRSRTTARSCTAPGSPSCGADVSSAWTDAEAGGDTSPTTGAPRAAHGLSATNLHKGLMAVVLILLFLLPPLLWAGRNYHVCGHFPVLSTLRGQTFYGGNNSVVADTLEYWGYWIFPNSIPGEPTMYELSRTMSEHEVDVYYFNRGVAWVRQHAAAMPRLVLGKLIRAYVPVPWKPSAKSAAVAGCRLALYMLSGIGLCLWWRRLDPAFRVVLVAMVLANALTVVLFWGCARFAFELDPVLIPFAALALTGRTRLTTASTEEASMRASAGYP